MNKIARLLMIVGLASAPAVALAQTCPTVPAGTVVVNPTQVCFEASADHDSTGPLSVSVSKYLVRIYLKGVDPTTGQPVTTVDLGKPAPVGPNKIIQMARSELGSLPAGQKMFATVDAVGSNGLSGRSPISNFFGRAQTGAPSPVKPPTITRRFWSSPGIGLDKYVLENTLSFDSTSFFRQTFESFDWSLTSSAMDLTALFSSGEGLSL